MTTASANDDANDDANDEKSATESLGLPHPNRAPLLIRPGLLFLVSLVGFAANWWAGVYQPAGLNLIGVACGKTAQRTGILTDVLLGIYALAGLVIVLAVVRCFWRRVGITSSLFAVIMVPIVIGCALFNIWMAYVTQTNLAVIAICGR